LARELSSTSDVSYRAMKPCLTVLTRLEVCRESRMEVAMLERSLAQFRLLPPGEPPLGVQLDRWLWVDTFRSLEYSPLFERRPCISSTTIAPKPG